MHLAFLFPLIWIIELDRILGHICDRFVLYSNYVLYIINCSMSGLRVVVSLAHSLERDQLGVAAICNGGGEAVAVLLRGC